MRLSALTLIVPSYDEGISFYCGTMGFELTQDEDQGHKRWVRVTPSGGGTAFILAEPGDDVQRAAIGNQGAGRVWYAPWSSGSAYGLMIQAGAKMTQMEMLRTGIC